MSLFLSVASLEEALGVIGRISPAPLGEEVPLGEALHRVLARDVAAREDIPGFARTTVDGYAVRAADTAGAGEGIPAILRVAGEVAMGRQAARGLAAGEGFALPTGAMLPPGADAAVMVEHTERIGHEVLVKRPVAPGENIILPAEDFAKGAVILPRGRLLSPRDTGILAAAGYERVAVFQKPAVGISSSRSVRSPARGR
jgi:molybdopterin molybdotransferase